MLLSRKSSIARQYRPHFAGFRFKKSLSLRHNLLHSSSLSPPSFFPRNRLSLRPSASLFLDLSANCELVSSCVLLASTLPSHIRCNSNCSLVPSFFSSLLDSTLPATRHSLYGSTNASSSSLSSWLQIVLQLFSPSMLPPTRRRNRRIPRRVRLATAHRHGSLWGLELRLVASMASPPCPHHLPRQSVHVRPSSPSSPFQAAMSPWYHHVLLHVLPSDQLSPFLLYRASHSAIVVVRRWTMKNFPES